MRLAPLPTVDSPDRRSLESFTGELIDAGFQPVGDETTWVGPIHDAFSGLTTAATMRIVIQDGWPFRHPKLFVDDLGPHLHLNPRGEVCLWEDADPSRQWETLDGFRSRVVEWCERARNSSSQSPTLDAHLYFGAQSERLALIDVAELERLGYLTLRPQKRGEIGARLDGNLIRIEKNGPIRVSWYFSDRVRVPPGDIVSIQSLLDEGAARNLARVLERVAIQHIILLLWHDAGVLNCLVVHVTRPRQREISASALEVARTDLAVLKLRAGLDARSLQEKRVVIFGVGAIGSNVAVLLSKSGLGHSCLVDSEVLRPADVARHAASHAHVGSAKAVALEALLKVTSPWTDVKTVLSRPWEPVRLEALVRDYDLVIESTGSGAFLGLLETVLRQSAPAPPLLSVALYRNGAIARTRLVVGEGRPISDRTPANGFPIIPAGPADESPVWETGCGSPVNNAPPVSVASAAASAARIAIDVLLGRVGASEDLVEVFIPLDEDGLRQPGPARFPA